MTAANYEATREELLRAVRDKLGPDTTEEHPVARWALSVFLRTLVTDESFRKRLSKPPKLDNAPEYLRRAVAKGEPLYRIAYDAAAFQHVLDFLTAAHVYGSLDPWGIARRQAGLEPVLYSEKDWLFHGLSWPDAVRLTETWVTAVNRITERMAILDLPEGHETTAVQLSDGWSLVRLETQEALRREGWRMRHCVGGGSYAQYLSEPDSGVYSLRDAGGKPWVTVAVWHETLSEMSGYANRESFESQFLKLLAQSLETIAAKGFYPEEIDERYGLLYLKVERKFILVEELPNGLTVSSFRHWSEYNLKSLPNDLTIRQGELSMSGSQSLERIDSNLRVEGFLDLSNCKNLTEIAEGLYVEGNLILDGCTSLKKLPNALHVGGNIHLDGCLDLIADLRRDSVNERFAIIYSDGKYYWQRAILADECTILFQNNDFLIEDDWFIIEGDFAQEDYYLGFKIPYKMIVNGNLQVKVDALQEQKIEATVVFGNLELGFQEYRFLGAKDLPDELVERNQNSTFELPRHLFVGGNLKLDNIPFERLSDELHVMGNIELSRCLLLKQLPDPFIAPASLTLNICPALKRLPKRVEVGGNLNVSALLLNLPFDADDQLHVTGDLNIYQRNQLGHLLRNLRVGGSLSLKDAKKLTRISGDLDIGGNLDLTGCTALREISGPVRVGKRLKLNGCRALERLPDSLEIGGDLEMSNCSSLNVLPTRMEIQGDARIVGATVLQQPPDILEVGGSLQVIDAPALQSLAGVRLRIGGDLILNRCPALTSLAPDVQVGGRIIVKDCERMKY